MRRGSIRKRTGPENNTADQSAPQERVSSQQQPQQGQQGLFQSFDTGGTSNGPDLQKSSMPFDSNLFEAMSAQLAVPDQSNQLAKRPFNQPLVAKSPFNNMGNGVWPVMTDTPQQQDPSFVPSKQDENLEREALEAMEASKKARKSIPPFVQKLRSFLDESKNTDLITWSPSGNSFIVIDAEEFSRTLIPELFKHDNFASFVRQLNMYGFSKQVGLSDNSMRASERKNKNPSEWANPYFKRGRPNLMWLIQKPKSSQAKGKGPAKVKGEGNVDDEDDQPEVENLVSTTRASVETTSTPRNLRQPLMIDQGGTRILAKEDLSALHQELRTVRQQHQVISGVIQKLRRDHEQLYQQASALQERNDRHENSINAILTFLATVYNRSLEGHGNQNVANAFANAIPRDIRELNTPPNSSSTPPLRRSARRQPLLLQAPPSNEDRIRPLDHEGSASTPIQATSTAPQFEQSNSAGQNGGDNGTYTQNGVSTSGLGGSNGFPFPERDIMSLINSTNARDANAPSGSKMNFPQALSHLQNSGGKSPLTPNERNGMLALMSGQGPEVSGSPMNNALIFPESPKVPAANMEDWNKPLADLESVQQQMKAQDDKMSEISNKIAPLSPSGSIPGLAESQDYVSRPPSDFDFDQILNSTAYFDPSDLNNENIDLEGDQPGFGDSSSFFDNTTPNFGFTEASGNGTVDGNGRVVETVNSSETTSPANTAEDIPPEETGNTRKRRRRN